MTNTESRTPPDVKCPRCGVSVPADKLDMKDRCLVKDCPLNNRSAS